MESELNMRKARISIIALLLLILLLTISNQPVAIKVVEASEASVIWRSTWCEAWFEDNGWPNEGDVSYDVCNYIDYLFDTYTSCYDLSYASTSGVNTTEGNILSYIQTCDGYDYATVFHYGHGINQSLAAYLIVDPWYSEEIWVHHSKYWDNNGEEVWDYEIWDHTDSGSHKFVFMWTCGQGRQIGFYDADNYENYPAWWYEGTGPSGMAYCWNQRDYTSLSSDGYGNPDQGEYCFIGFEGWSKPLSEATGYSGYVYGDFVKWFYQHALQGQRTVNGALDDGSYALGYESFGSTPFYQGWIENVTGYGNWPSKMHIYGNGNNYIPTSEYEITALAKDQDGNLLPNEDVYIDGQYVGTTGNSFTVLKGSHTIQISGPSGYVFQNYTFGAQTSAENPLPLSVTSDLTVTAYYAEPAPPGYHWLTVYAQDQYGYVPTGVYVDSGQWTGVAGDPFCVPAGNHYVEVDWEVDRGEWGVDYFYCFNCGDIFENPVYITVDSDTEITAIYFNSP